MTKRRVRREREKEKERVRRKFELRSKRRRKKSNVKTMPLAHRIACCSAQKKKKRIEGNERCFGLCVSIEREAHRA